MAKVLFDVRDYKQVPRGKRARIKLFDAESGEEIEAGFVEQHQQFVASDLKPGRYRVVVEDEDPKLEKEEREVEIKPEEAKREHPLRKRVLLYERKPQQIAVDFRPTKKDLNEPLPVELDDGTKVELKPVLSKEQVDEGQQTTQVFEAEDEKQIKEVMAKLGERDDVRQVGQILRGSTEEDPAIVYLTDTLIVYFEEEVPEADALQIVTDVCGAESVKKFQRVSLGKNSYELQLDNASYEILEKAEALSQNSQVISAKPVPVEPMILLADLTPNDEHYHRQKNYLDEIDALAGWRRLYAATGLEFGSPSVAIGVLDSCTMVKEQNGQRELHPDLDGDLLDQTKNPPEVVEKLVKAWDVLEESESSSGLINAYHAYAVTGLATALANNDGQGIAGLAGSCRLISVGMGSTLLDDIKAMAWMSGKDTAGRAFNPADVALPGDPEPPELGVDVINNSWARRSDLDPREVWRKLATEGRDGKGILIVFGAGNDGIQIPKEESESYLNSEFVITVAATYNERRAKYSDWGNAIDVCAPSGEGRIKNGLFTLAHDDKPGAIKGQKLGGTSMAAPQVTGALALALSANPALTQVQAKTLLHDSADHLNYPRGEPVNPGGGQPDVSSEWTDEDKDGIPEFNLLYGYGRLNVGRLVRLALLTSQHRVYFQADESDVHGDLFKRTGPAWDSPSLIIEPAAGGQGRQVRAKIFNGSDRPISAQEVAEFRVQFFTADPTTFAPGEDVDWAWLGEARFVAAADIPSGGELLSEPVLWPTILSSSPKLLFAQMVGAGHLPEKFLERFTDPGDYATLLRWTGLLAWKQPELKVITLAPGSSDKFFFSIGRFKGSKPWTTLCFDLSEVPQDVKVSIKLAKSLVDSLLRNNNDRFPPGIEKEGEDTQGVILSLDPSQFDNNDNKVIYLRGLKLSKLRYPIQLMQTYSATPGVYTSSVSISQYLDGHWVGLVKRQVEVTIQ